MSLVWVLLISSLFLFVFLFSFLLPLSFDSLFHLLQLLVFPYIRGTPFLILLHIVQLFN